MPSMVMLERMTESVDHISKPLRISTPRLLKLWMAHSGIFHFSALIHDLLNERSSSSHRYLAYSADRQTVLEPITRFCNYFPDINECNEPSMPHSLSSSLAAVIYRAPSQDQVEIRLADPQKQALKSATTSSSITTPPVLK